MAPATFYKLYYDHCKERKFFFRGSLANKRQAFLNLKSVKAGGDGVGERVGLDDGRGGDDSTVSSVSESSGEDAAGGGGSGGDEAEESKLKTTLTLSRSTVHLEPLRSNLSYEQIANTVAFVALTRTFMMCLDQLVNANW